MSKNTIRKKSSGPGATPPPLRFDAKNPLDVGVPCAVYLVFKLCEKCRAGWMMPTGRILELGPGKPAGMIHQCDNDLCKATLTIHGPPYPRPDFNPLQDIGGKAEQIGQLVGRLMQGEFKKGEIVRDGGQDGQTDAE